MSIRPIPRAPGRRRCCVAAMLVFTLAGWLPATGAENPLAHSRWTAVGEARCPDAIYFGVRRYLFLNRCHAPAADGVVERGTYAFDGSRIELLEREPLGDRGLDGIGPALRVLEVERLGDGRLRLRVGDRLIEFRRSRPPRLLPAAAS